VTKGKYSAGSVLGSKGGEMGKEKRICGYDKNVNDSREEELCEERKHGGPSGLCIFRAPNEEKTAEEFWTAFKNI
jgi:hypothetical protein